LRGGIKFVFFLLCFVTLDLLSRRVIESVGMAHYFTVLCPVGINETKEKYGKKPCFFRSKDEPQTARTMT